MLIWKYDGFYYLNKNEVKNLNILNENRYSNDLMIAKDNYLIFPKYEKDYTFNSIIVINMETGKYSTIKYDYDINIDSYYAGSSKNILYLFDNKNEKLYEINYKKDKITLVGSESLGYFKLVKGKEVKASINEYTKEKITCFEEEGNVISADSNIITLDNGFKYLYNNNDVKVIKVIDDEVFFIYKDEIFKYSKGTTKFICHDFELNFNSDNVVYVYQK